MEHCKYVRTKNDEIIIFPSQIQHDTFRFMNPVSAGFCKIRTSRRLVDCFGESFSLNLKADRRGDTLTATTQFFGFDATLDLIDKKF